MTATVRLVPPDGFVKVAGIWVKFLSDPLMSRDWFPLTANAQPFGLKMIRPNGGIILQTWPPTDEPTDGVRP